jgi:hypothetical protein
VKKIKEFLNSFELENLEYIMFETVVEWLNGRDGAEEILYNESDNDAENIIGPFSKKLGLKLEEFGFEKDSQETFGFGWESTDDDNTFAFESLMHDMSFFLNQCAESVSCHVDEVLDDSVFGVPTFEQLWNDEPY